ncbi:hypothetical protein JCM6882_001213 [Rhodosporidiobolus microsporus]
MSSTIPGLPACPPPVLLFSPSSPTPSSSAPPPPAPSPPKRKIFTAPDLVAWPSSEAYAVLTQTILRLVYAVKGRSNGEAVEEGEAVTRLVRFLRDAKRWVAEVPLDDGPQRFGNKAFRVWVQRVEEAEPSLQRDLLTLSPLPTSTTALLAPELTFHLLSSLGSTQRLDYGTGHELSFLSFLALLLRAGVFSEQQEPALVTRVFAAYLETVREAQRVFRLEPAGSKGVWGLDDFQHLSYLFGASQLIDHPSLRPSSIPTPPSPSLSSSNLLSSSLTHIHTLKRGPFHEHSPLLHQISTTVPTWAKVTKGLWEMYKVEVLGKLPIVQHVRFGAGLQWADARTGEEMVSSGDGRDDEDEAVGAEDEAALGGSVITPAPWASTASSNGVRPLPPSSRLPSSHAPTTSSFSAAASSSSSASSAFSRRQHPTTFPLPPHPSAAPRSFAPPTLFPPRRTTATAASASSGEHKQRGETTLAEQGGAAAADSPFGVLPKARLAGQGGEGTGGVGRDGQGA